MSSKKFKVDVNLRLCKGCLICKGFCPYNIFEATEDAKVKVVNEEKCIGCRACENRCPDYAIELDVIRNV